MFELKSVQVGLTIHSRHPEDLKKTATTKGHKKIKLE